MTQENLFIIIAVSFLLICKGVADLVYNRKNRDLQITIDKLIKENVSLINKSSELKQECEFLRISIKNTNRPCLKCCNAK